MLMGRMRISDRRVSIYSGLGVSQAELPIIWVRERRLVDSCGSMGMGRPD